MKFDAITIDTDIFDQNHLNLGEGSLKSLRSAQRAWAAVSSNKSPPSLSRKTGTSAETCGDSSASTRNSNPFGDVETLAGIENASNWRAFSCVGPQQGRDATAWLGRQDSNLGMAESKSAALPLGYDPSRRDCAAALARPGAGGP